ncbi:MAG: hypothetical protein COB02_02755 [Candidatus Cloacimonadota bacterium]|nr:MAG: hypothetical protein COB02_02755 [Candidatus Cloacimonadota bacterium]
MKKDPALQHVQILAVLILAILFMADGMLQGKMPQKIKAFKRNIKTNTEQLRNYENLKLDISDLRIYLDENKEIMTQLFEKFQSNDDSEIEINKIITNITRDLILVNSKNKPKYITMFVGKNTPEYTVPLIGKKGANLKVGNAIDIAKYEQNLEIRANYFEFLNFLHDLANQERYFEPISLEMKPDPDVPYGILAKLKLITFGVLGYNKGKKRR